MSETTAAVLALLSMIGAAILGLFGKTKVPSDEDTNGVIGLVAALFVVMTSLVIGLMLNSARSTLETNNLNIRTFATQLTLLDRTMRSLGPDAEVAHQRLVEYVQTVLKEVNILEDDPQAEALLDAAGTKLNEIAVSDEQKVAVWNDARQLYRQVIQQRWVVIDAAGGSIPTALIIALIVCLAIIFASFGYRAPRNTFVMASLLLAALLLSAIVYLIEDMDTANSGVIEVSKVPFQQALAELQR